MRLLEKVIKDYTLTKGSSRSPGGYAEESTGFEIEFGFPVDEHGGNKLTVYSPYCEVTQGETVIDSGCDSAADCFDTFISSGIEVAVRYNPSPVGEGGPRIKVTAGDLTIDIY